MQDWLLLGLVVIFQWWNLNGFASLRSETRKIMADIDDLNSQLDTISAEVDALASEFTSLEQELQELHNTTPPEVDLSGALTKVASIRTRLEAIGQAADTTSGTEAQDVISDEASQA